MGRGNGRRPDKCAALGRAAGLLIRKPVGQGQAGRSARPGQGVGQRAIATRGRGQGNRADRGVLNVVLGRPSVGVEARGGVFLHLYRKGERSRVALNIGNRQLVGLRGCGGGGRAGNRAAVGRAGGLGVRNASRQGQAGRRGARPGQGVGQRAIATRGRGQSDRRRDGHILDIELCGEGRTERRHRVLDDFDSEM